MSRLLLLSNSTNFGEPFLAYPEPYLRGFLGKAPGELVFVPFAGVRISWDEYAQRVRARFEEMGYAIRSLHDAADPAGLVRRAGAIVVGGGNSFYLLAALYERGLLEPIRERVAAGASYVGWSAGANLACPTIRTTNDMPVVEPPSLRALGLVPFQINPHFTEARLPGHNGETRGERLAEFVQVNPALPVIGLPEGTLLRVEGGRVELLGPHPATLFRHGRGPEELAPGPVIGNREAGGGEEEPISDS